MLTGIGGQGIQFACQVLARALMLEGRHVLSLGTYGGTMRGGNTDATLVFADAPVSSPPIIAEGWSAIAMHHRFWAPTREKLRANGVLLINEGAFDDRPGAEPFRRYAIPATAMAAARGLEMGASLIMIAAYARLTGLLAREALEQAVEDSLPPYRRKHLAGNIALIASGFDAVEGNKEPAWSVAA